MAKNFGGVKYRFKGRNGVKTGPISMSRVSKLMMESLGTEIAKIEGDIDLALEAAALFIKGKAQEITPVRFGILINSAFTSLARVGGKAVARIGYTAKYAPAVHEMPASTNFTKPGSERKFLESAVLRNVSQILKIIKDHAKR